MRRWCKTIIDLVSSKFLQIPVIEEMNDPWATDLINVGDVSYLLPEFNLI